MLVTYYIYFLISENGNKTYVGYCEDLRIRISQHRNGKVRTTINFGNFNAYLLEKTETQEMALKKRKILEIMCRAKKTKKDI